MLKGSVNSIESLGLVDGPGIRTVIFLNGCSLRCKYCHNPEMFLKGNFNMTTKELLDKIKRYKPYYKRNNGGVTFSGGEPLMQPEFLLEMCKLLKKEHIHITLDTAGYGIGDHEEILKYVDLIIFDIKHTNPVCYKELTSREITKSEEFLKIANKLNKKFWIRQVVIPNLTDSIEYLESLKIYLTKINNIEKITFLPFHHLGEEKYDKLGLDYPFKKVPEMDAKKCHELYNKFMKMIEV
jgi:pyruvate formate lyase activating enzyme